VLPLSASLDPLNRKEFNPLWGAGLREPEAIKESHDTT
jgi:hypothetical protein